MNDDELVRTMRAHADALPPVVVSEARVHAGVRRRRVGRATAAGVGALASAIAVAGVANGLAPALAPVDPGATSSPAANATSTGHDSAIGLELARAQADPRTSPEQLAVLEDGARTGDIPDEDLTPLLDATYACLAAGDISFATTERELGDGYVVPDYTFDTEDATADDCAATHSTYALDAFRTQPRAQQAADVVRDSSRTEILVCVRTREADGRDGSSGADEPVPGGLLEPLHAEVHRPGDPLPDPCVTP